MKKLHIALLCVALVLLSACGGAQIRTFDSYLDGDMPAAKVEQAIRTAASDLGWSTRKLSGSTLEATLIVRGHEVVIDIPYTAKGYSMKYKDSKNMSYNAEKKTIHAKYNKWLVRLDKRIKKELRR